MTIKPHPSPNSARRAAKVDTIVLHNTVGSLAGSLAVLCTAGTEKSCHYIVAENGDVYQLVNEDRTAWHAGVSAVNHRSIGIEVVDIVADPGMTAPQEASLVELVRSVVQRHKIPGWKIIPHRSVRATQCPGLVWPTDNDLKVWIAKNITKESVTT